MRTFISHKPALVRYFHLLANLVRRAWFLYRFATWVEVMAEVVLR